MADNTKQDAFRVIIVGGSIAGLVLAHSLHHAGIDYVVLEAMDRIDPQVGASIGIFSNGARVLDQLGVYDEIERHTEPPVWHEMITGEGKLVQKVDSLQLIEARTGYPVAFLERQRVLKILYDRHPDKTKILTGKRVVSVDHLSSSVLVHCEDGSEFSGDIVAGADGVHSRIRREMWRHAGRDNALKGLISDQRAMSAEYRCLFGISSPVPGLEEKAQYRAFNKDWSFLVVIGKDRQCFWFVFEKLDRVYRVPDIPRYTVADQTEFVKPFMKRYVSQTVTFDALWMRKTASTLTSLEEAQYQHWTYGRFVCLGDAIHKMTPNIGQGGNWAIESAASLANNLCALRQTNRLTIGHLQNALKQYEQSRQPRTKEVCNTAGFATRLEAFATLGQRLFSLYVVPKTGDILVDVHCQAVMQAPKLDFLPIPKKSLDGGMPLQTSQDDVPSDKPLVRVFRAFPLVGLLLAARFTLGASFHSLLPRTDPTNPTENVQTVRFLGDSVPLFIVFMVESCRRGNNFTFAALWALFGLVGQWKGMAYAVPTYCFLHYVQSPLDRYAAPDNRLVPTNYAKTLIAAVGTGYILPTVGAFFGIAGPVTYWIWQLFPICIAVVHRAFASLVSDTTAADRIKNPRADMKGLRHTYAVGTAVGVITSLYLWTTAPGYMGHIDLGALEWQKLASPVADRAHLLQYYHMITFGSGLIWQLLHFWDLKSKGRLNDSWIKIVGVFTGTTVLFGPGTALTVAWAWREEVLARGPKREI